MRPDPMELEDVEAPTPPEVTLDLEARLVHPRLGILRGLLDVPPRPGEVPLRMVSSFVGSRLPLRLAGVTPQMYGSDDEEGPGGTGAARDARLARARAIGEGVERYALLTTAHVPRERAPFREVREEAVAPDAIACVSARERERFPFVHAYYEQTPFHWVWGTDLLGERSVRVPAVFVHPRWPRPREEYLTPAFPAASACANTLAEAVAGALSESIERDALSLFWATKRPLPRVRLDTVEDEAFQFIRAGTEEAGRELHLFDMTSDVGYPAFIAFIVDRSGRGPALAAGTGAGFDTRAAARRAAEEAVHMRQRLTELVSLRAGSARAKRPGGLHWAEPANLPELDWLLERPRSTDLPKAREAGGVRSRLNVLVGLLASRGLSPIALDVTAPDVREVGLSVAATLVPGLLPKSYYAGFWHAATPRLQAASRGGGLSDLPLPYA